MWRDRLGEWLWGVVGMGLVWLIMGAVWAWNGWDRLTRVDLGFVDGDTAVRSEA
jgi:hypothetical protein